MTGTNRGSIKSGLRVLIVLKKDQRSGKLMEGMVKDARKDTALSLHDHKKGLQFLQPLRIFVKRRQETSYLLFSGEDFFFGSFFFSLGASFSSFFTFFSFFSFSLPTAFSFPFVFSFPSVFSFFSTFSFFLGAIFPRASLAFVMVDFFFSPRGVQR